MASTQSGIVAKLYKTWLSRPGDDEPLGGQTWDVLTAEPRGVDYIEVDAGGVPALWAAPKGCAEDRVLLAIHGGGFISGSIYTHRKLFAHIARAAGVRALVMGYRLLPEGAYPGALDDVVTAYRWLLDDGIDAGHVAFTGDSAGGGLSVTAQLRARSEGLPLPAASMPLSPWVDFEVAGETMRSNAGRDALFTQTWIQELAANYLAGASPRNPFANPLHADLAGLGPMYIQVGDQELLLAEARSLADRARRAGVDVRLDEFEGQQHTFQMAAGRAAEADDAVARLGEWVRPRLGLPAGKVRV